MACADPTASLTAVHEAAPWLQTLTERAAVQLAPTPAEPTGSLRTRARLRQKTCAWRICREKSAISKRARVMCLAGSAWDLGSRLFWRPRAVSRSIGLSDHSTLMRAVGLRELASGAGLLTQRDRTPWLWSRVVGDAMDLALIGSAAVRPGNPRRGRALGALAVVGAITAIDYAASAQLTSRSRQGGEPVTGGHEAFVEQAMIVNRSPQECYAYWRDLANLPRFIRMLQSIAIKDERKFSLGDASCRWREASSGIRRSQWTAPTSESPGTRSNAPLSLMRAACASIRHPARRGCIVRVLMHYRPPMGRAGVGLAKLLGRDPNTEAREDLRRFKALIETGEIPTTRGQPSGRRSWLGRRTPDGRGSREGRILEERHS